MRKRGIHLIFVVLVAGGVLVAVFAGREREPEYGGKRLSEWVTTRNTDAERDQAIRAIGTNALPCLVKWISF